MDVSIAEAKNRLPELIRAVEQGEQVVITRHGKPVAQLAPAPPERRPIRWGAMRDRVKLLPGWDDPLSEEELLGRFCASCSARRRSGQGRRTATRRNRALR